MSTSDEMFVTWAATSLTTGRYNGVPTTSARDPLVARVDELLARGCGYCEVQVQGRDYPVLSIAFDRDYSVVHCWWDAEHMSLLAGDGSVARDDDVEVLIADDATEWPSTFTGQFVSARERGKSLLERFLQDGDAESLGDWYNL